MPYYQQALESSEDPQDGPHGIANERRVLREQVQYLVNTIDRLEANMPSEAELVELRAIKLERERARWLTQLLRTYAPWVLGVGGPLISGAYWLATHFTFNAKP